MQEERDHLVKVIFPELRRRCRERAVEFVEVDLRWGVTEEQAERGETLPICLAEIENCRPYFIALLGERYGYVPERIDSELERTQRWLAEHREHSITALEILHGALNNPQMAKRACFYFRDPSYLERIPPERRADFASESPAAHAKLEALKGQIRHSGLALKEHYPDPETCGEWILADLWQAIDQAYPLGTEPDPLDREAIEHEAFAQSRARVYIGR
jgi:nephrocystin-3